MRRGASIVGLVLLALPALGRAQGQAKEPPPAPEPQRSGSAAPAGDAVGPRDPARFTEAAVLRRLYASHRQEAQAGAVAHARAGSLGVRDLGERLQRDHQAEAEAAAALAKRKGISLAEPGSPLHVADVQHLHIRSGELQSVTNLRGGVYDARFLELTMGGHEELRDYLQAARDAVQDPELRSLLGAELPMAETHAQLARDLYSRTNRHAVHLGRAARMLGRH